LQKKVKPCVPSRTIILDEAADMTFSFIPPGTFLMGSPPDEEGRTEDETQHRVTLTKGYYLGAHPVTHAQWRAVMGSDPDGREQADDHPVTNVSWEDARRFCQELKKRDGQPYRLPTEAEWENACRAGTTTPFFFGPTISASQANYNGNAVYGEGKKGKNRKEVTPVGSFKPNAWGLYDLHGNVWEWCADWCDDLPAGEQTDPKGPSRGQTRVMRGGARGHHPNYLRSAARGAVGPDYREGCIGFRVAVRAS
jgi:formylglycine-generating enzyme required for sulfatase activity